MGRIYDFTIPDLPKTPNNLLRKHWTIVSKEKTKWHRLVSLCCLSFQGDPMIKARVSLVRYSTREPDYDGLTGSFKFVLDGLVKAGVLIDDKPSVVSVEYSWKKARQSDQGIFVGVEEV